MHPFFFFRKRLTVHRVMAFLPLFFILFDGNAQLHAESLQDLFDQERLSGNIEHLQERLDELKERKIDINEAEPEALRELPWLNGGDVLTIIDYRRSKGRFISLRQLQDVIGREKAVAISPYIDFFRVKERALAEKKVQTPEVVTGSYAGRILWDTTPRNGLFPTAKNPVPRYAGDEYKLYNRFQLNYANYRLSMVHDKDIGEPDAADFLSLSIAASDLGIVKTAVLGNYEINAGQGLLIGQSRFLSKGSEPSNSVRLSSKRLSAYGSSSEYGFFQGAAATIDFSPFEVTAFYSANKVDAVINKKTALITSFNDSGYHRTTTERDRKDNVTEIVYGASALYRYSSGPVSGKVGGTWLRYDYGEPMAVLDEEHQSSALGSLEADVSIGRLGLFGEAACSERPEGSVSWIAGAEYQLFKKVNLLLAVRDYAEGYYSPFAGAFAERGDGGSNERGVYLGIDAALSSKVSVGAYYDWFRFPKLDSKDYPYPSSGYDTRFFLDWKQSRAVTWTLQLQHKEKEVALKQCPDGAGSCDEEEELYAPLGKVTDRVRLDCDIDALRKLTLRTRGEVKRVVKEYLAGDESCYGWLVYQQAGYKAGKFGLKGRFTIFNTDDYDASIYVYEDDLPLVFNSTGFNGRGKAFFILGTWDVTKNLKLAGKFETTWYDDREVYGDSTDQRNTSAPGTFHFGCSLKF
ncbi:MAG: helix-hairpin-helix domain-containing protein [Chlorobium limicola]|uniref:ComEA family DNA-binding protein n=1 Tax=Chlorobium limicola TaxID=1092 RepID=UPI0023F23C92|nr:helix-hairpin-helix domain-containing protein [Chlorobium limicola]NTV21011.1 helix-hairpin-helix domain-containing protein [Chlorobium limicola]